MPSSIMEMEMEMESYEDDLLLPLPEQPPSPIPQRKLKRLKKVSTAPSSPPPAFSTVDLPAVLEKSMSPDREKSAEATVDPPISRSECFGKDVESDDGLDPLFSVPSAGKGFETLDREGEGEEEEERLGLFVERGGWGKGKKESSARKRLSMEEGEKEEISKKKKRSARKRLSMEEGEKEEISKKKKRKKKSKNGEMDDQDGTVKESVRDNRRVAKERRVQLELIHAESQKLLRETRDASFKPVPLVQKPISSVLEKIRLRKLEVLKKNSILGLSDSVADATGSRDEVAQNSEQYRVQGDARDNKDVKDDYDQGVDVRNHGSLLDPCKKSVEHNQVDIASHKSPVDLCKNNVDCDQVEDVASDKSPDLLEDNQQVTNGAQHSDGETQLDALEDSPAPVMPPITSTVGPDDVSSSEEDDDKENVDPHQNAAVNRGSSPQCGLARAFVDDEAEEEDDSDHDLMRFQENEEDDESDENEVLNDLIATGYEEAPIDHEKRNELHQKWLEQQDAAETDDVLQRLKCGQGCRETEFLDDDDHEYDSDFEDEESEDYTTDNQPRINVVRQNSKKAKQMIAQMFTDPDDVYVPSDDEETEQSIIRQRIVKQTDEPSFTSLLEDEHSREVFGLIKKLNIARPAKKGGKVTASSFDTLVKGGNSNSSSKSSFLNRATSNSQPSLHKQGSATVRMFVFGRDDSNSRSGLSTSENTTDMGQKENQSLKPATSTKFISSSQSKSTSSKTKIRASGSGSLFEILRHSSMQFDKQLNKNGTSNRIMETQAAHQFSAFKVGRRV